MVLRVLELYCGIGGMHWALKRTEMPFEIVAAMEINPSVLEIYSHNFPDDCFFNRNIQSLTVQELNDMKIDLIAMSPPCQPFCRTGLRKDIKDPRTDSLQHLLKILPSVSFRYILLENVKGFEESEAHQMLVQTLQKCNFRWQEFLLTPRTLGIPNSRLRYYMIGKQKDIEWCFDLSDSILSNIPNWDHPSSEVPFGHIRSAEADIWEERREKLVALLNDSDSDNIDKVPSSWCVGDVIEHDLEPNSNLLQYVKPNIKLKYGKAMDIVNWWSDQTCCFTKSYGQYVKGTGSILDPSGLTKIADDIDNLRFFTPREILRLLCFPDTFNFPETLSWKQKCQSLGNSINVYVVAILMATLVTTGGKI